MLTIRSKNKKAQSVACAVLSDRMVTVACVSMATDGLPELLLLENIEVIDQADAVTTLVRFISQSKLTGLDWNIVLTPGQYQLLQVDVPDIPEEEINDTLRLKASDLIQYPISEAAISVIRLPDEAFRGRIKMAYLAVSQAKRLNSWADEFGLTGINLKAVDIADMAMRNIGLLASQKKNFAVIEINTTLSNMYCCSGQMMCLHRRIEIGTANFELADDEDSNSIQIQLDATSLEIQRSLDYFESQMGLGTIDDIILLTSKKFPEDNIRQLNKMLHPDIHRWSPEDHLKNPNFLPMPETSAEFQALGGSLRNLERQQ